MDAPIFVVGANRSGTTLVRLILNAHSRIAIPDELTYFGPSIAGVPVAQWRSPSLSSAAYEAFVDDFLETSCAPFLNDLDRKHLRSTILSQPPNLRTPYQTVLRAWAHHHGKARWGEKTPGNLFYVDHILDMFPDARFVYVVRDPRAGVASMQKVSFFPDDVVFNALSRRKHWRAGHQYLERAVPAAQRLTLRYEDLVQEPERYVRQLCTFVGERFEPAMLSFYQDANQYMKTGAATRYNQAATKPISSDRIRGWTRQLTAADVAVVETICTPEMREFGYEPTQKAPPVRTLLEILIKSLYWRVQSWRNPYRHYTVKSPIFARMRHRLGLL